MGRCKSLGIIEVIPFICISAIWGQHPVFLISPSPHPAPQQSLGVGVGGGRGGEVASAGSQALFSLLGALIHIWRPEIAGGCYLRVC